MKLEKNDPELLARARASGYNDETLADCVACAKEMDEDPVRHIQGIIDLKAECGKPFTLPAAAATELAPFEEEILEEILAGNMEPEVDLMPGEVYPNPDLKP